MVNYPVRIDSRSRLTVEDFYQLLKRIPAQARRENYLMAALPGCDSRDVTGLQISQSDQAEKWEFKMRIRLERREGDE